MPEVAPFKTTQVILAGLGTKGCEPLAGQSEITAGDSLRSQVDFGRVQIQFCFFPLRLGQPAQLRLASRVTLRPAPLPEHSTQPDEERYPHGQAGGECELVTPNQFLETITGAGRAGGYRF